MSASTSQCLHEKTDTDGLVNWALFMHICDAQDLTSTEKLVCYTLLRHRNMATGLCFPNVRTIMAEARLSRSGVFKALASLEAKEWLERRELETFMVYAKQYVFEFDRDVYEDLRLRTP